MLNGLSGLLTEYVSNQPAAARGEFHAFRDQGSDEAHAERDPDVAVVGVVTAESALHNSCAGLQAHGDAGFELHELQGPIPVGEAHRRAPSAG